MHKVLLHLNIQYFLFALFRKKKVVPNRPELEKGISIFLKSVVYAVCIDILSSKTQVRLGLQGFCIIITRRRRVLLCSSTDGKKAISNLNFVWEVGVS